jgi:hypothetical protein
MVNSVGPILVPSPFHWDHCPRCDASPTRRTRLVVASDAIASGCASGYLHEETVLRDGFRCVRCVERGAARWSDP